MRKISAVLGTMLLTFFLANSAMAQLNQNAYFLIDTDLATSGFQASQPKATGIAANANVGFALYSQAWDSSKGFKVHFEWDSTKAAYRTANSGPDIVDNDITINGASITPPAETNIIGSSRITAGEINTPGVYEISVAQQGGTASTTAVGLIYFAVLRTVSSFTVNDKFAVAASVTVADANAAERFLGTRYFYVNEEIDVKTSSWGQVKKQFKDF
jgi:hypothetical protein